MHPLAAGSPFHSVAAPGNALRAIEQSLFMIGYDLGSDRIATAA